MIWIGRKYSMAWSFGAFAFACPYFTLRLGIIPLDPEAPLFPKAFWMPVQIIVLEEFDGPQLVVQGFFSRYLEIQRYVSDIGLDKTLLML